MAQMENNLAYALPPEELTEKREIRHRAAPRNRLSKRAAVMYVFMTIVTLVLLSALIFGKVEISRLYTQRSELEAELAQLQRENVDFRSELAEKTNMTKIEEYAEEQLGLQKLNKAQIEYVEVKTPSKAEVKKNGDENAFVKLKHWFSSALEYLGL
ncbi:MAG: cell division protein FtsL [Ruminococcus sp.]|nr:cell division protein FtsL [Ruminococcus sp.]